MNNNRNPVAWFEIYVSDMERAQRFYEIMLDITMEDLPSPDPEIIMKLFVKTDTSDCNAELPGASGALCKMDGVHPGGGGTLVYFSCSNCAVEEQRAANAGGQVIKPKFPIGPYGFISLIADTEGNVIGLHSLQ